MPPPSGAATDAPPDASLRPALPGQSGLPLGPNGLPIFQPHGIDLQKVFSDNVTDPMVRIKRVENAVVELRRDFDAMMPAIARLVGVEQDMQNLTKQLGLVLQNDNGAGGDRPWPECARRSCHAGRACYIDARLGR